MRINHNIAALKSCNQLKSTNNALATSIERLSSGYRINKAADDAAGLAISQKMKTQIAGLNRASDNAADGISVIQTAEGALSEVEAILQRMRELSVQAANDTNTNDDRAQIQEEIEALKSEIQRISDDTEFNTKSLLNGNLDRKSYSDNPDIQITSVSESVKIGEYEVEVTQDASSTTLEAGGDISGFSGITSDMIPEGEDSVSLTVNTETIQLKEGMTKDEVMDAIQEVCDIQGISLSAKDANGVGTAITHPAAILTMTCDQTGSAENIDVYSSSSELLDQLGLSSATKTQGTDVNVTLTGDFSKTCTVSTNGNNVKIKDKDGFEMKLTVDAKVDTTTTPPTYPTAKMSVLDAGPMVLQIGANEGQTVEVQIPEVSPSTLEVEDVNLCTRKGASEAITTLDAAINMVSTCRAKLGAYQNRLDHAISNLDVSAENITDALSRIEDTDMASEMATYTQKNVLSQAGTSMLAQANQMPQNILSLLQS